MSDKPGPVPKYRRILLKLSGETLQSRKDGRSIDPEIVAGIARRVMAVHRMGVTVGIVVGGGNIFRGANAEESGLSRTTGDYMGMLGTIINGLALQSGLEREGVATRLQTAIEMRAVAEPFIVRRALRHLEKERVLIFAGGTGNPYFSTDTAAALRASEIGAEVLVKATKVDGIYSSDPMKNPSAVKFRHMTYRDALQKSIRVMDATAFSLCMENRIPIIVLNFFEEGSLERAVMGEEVGTLVNDSEPPA
ncbi:MAG: UMP kinase [Lentisphaerae bacterium]|nr:UMP kinase [Lentisphaerota bacterium]